MTARYVGSTIRPKSWIHSLSSEPDRGAAHGNLRTAVIAIIGHDLRQPLQNIASARDVLATMLNDTEQRKELARAETATSRLATVLSQLVDAVELQEQASGYRHEMVPLRPILRQLTSEFNYSAQARGICLRVVRSSKVVWSHPVLLSGILRNLVRNAIDYTPRGGSVFVGCRRRGSDVHIEVRASRVGIAPSQLATIYRADTTRTDGLRLGLFIVQRAAQLLAHRVDVCSAVGRGSCFTVVARRPFFDPGVVRSNKIVGATGTEPCVSASV